MSAAKSKLRLQRLERIGKKIAPIFSQNINISKCGNVNLFAFVLSERGQYKTIAFFWKIFIQSGTLYWHKEHVMWRHLHFDYDALCLRVCGLTLFGYYPRLRCVYICVFLSFFRWIIHTLLYIIKWSNITWFLPFSFSNETCQWFTPWFFFLLSEQAAKMSRQREDGKAYSNLQYWQLLTDKIFLSGTKGCFFFVVKDNFCLIRDINYFLQMRQISGKTVSGLDLSGKDLYRRSESGRIREEII